MRLGLPVRTAAAALVLFCGTTLFCASCMSSTGYRDQALAAFQKGGERGARGRSRAISADAVRTEEFLSAYQYDLHAAAGSQLDARLVLGGRGADRERGEGYLLVALAAPTSSEAALPPRRWAIALDTSHSMGDAGRWPLAVAAASRLVARLRTQDRVTLLLFGSTTEVPALWVTPEEASRRLGDLAAKPNFSDNGHRAGLLALGRILLDGQGPGLMPSGFYVSEMEGAPESLSRTMQALAASGAEVNVVGLAGGNEVLLREVARESSGTYLFLRDAGAIERNLGARLSELCDVAARDVRVSLWVKDGTEMNGAEEEPEGREESRFGSAAEASGEQVLTPEGPGRLGPGETWVRLWRLKRLHAGMAADFTARVTGRDASGREFRLVVRPTADYLTPSDGSPEARTLLKAVTIERETAILREALAGGYRYGRRPFADVMAQLRAVRDEVRDAQETLHDPEFARDLEGLDSASRLTEAEVARYREEWRSGGCCSPPLLLCLVALPFAIIGKLLFGL
ncbi:MAG: VWA domain-containing protein [Planctomycetes bacterium]|nr:VWA domain-containing protein [Planctomycetota bacterium]